MSPRPPLQKDEFFSQNPRTKKYMHHIPVLTLLGINKSGYSIQTSRTPKKKLPNLTDFCQLKDNDIENIIYLPGAPLRPTEVLKIFPDKLSLLELAEILGYKEIYYIGEIEAKPAKAFKNEHYLDKKKHYSAKPNDQIAYRYQILSTAGSGAFSRVYRCFDHKLHRPVAIKIIRGKEECLQYSEIEAEIQGSLHSNHIVAFYEAFSWRGLFCFSMELLYTDIYSIIETKKYGILKPSIIRRVTYQILQALSLLASKKVVHADIKPENILAVDPNIEQVKLGDFGTSCYEDSQLFSYIQSRYYRAPEVLFGIHYDSQIDIWSLGCVVYELITGEPLFPAENEEELFKMITIMIGPPPIDVFIDGSKFHEFDLSFGMMIDKPSLPSKIALLPTGMAQFIQNSIVWDPEKRITPDQALQLKWMESERLASTNQPKNTQINQKQNLIKSPRIKKPWH